jgi:orotidine-5'-phosphate decarboxylase
MSLEHQLATGGSTGTPLESFFTKLELRVAVSNSLLCVGIDPTCSLDSLYDYCSGLVEETHHLAAAFKLNFAFFFAFGAEGLAILKKVICVIPKSIPVILDAKFSDIGNASQVEYFIVWVLV